MQVYAQAQPLHPRSRAPGVWEDLPRSSELPCASTMLGIGGSPGRASCTSNCWLRQMGFRLGQVGRPSLCCKSCTVRQSLTPRLTCAFYDGAFTAPRPDSTDARFFACVFPIMHVLVTLWKTWKVQLKGNEGPALSPHLAPQPPLCYLSPCSFPGFSSETLPHGWLEWG